MSDEEEGPPPDLPTLPEDSMSQSTQRRPPPPSTLPTGLKSQQDSGTTRLSVGGSDNPQASSQRRKWASVTSNSFDLSGDEGGTPAVFGVLIVER